ncbi:MAG: T9SS type A sorting domain-containing protein [Ignavibacteria bacterium]|nr:T9SS type A sorting domain-containing protein [Ignavibacteria bacterium]
MYKTTDGGYNWKRENCGTSTSIIFSIEAYNDSVVWASRGNGTIIHTVNGGQTDIKKLNSFQTANYKLYQNYPNPFNPTTNIEFAIPKDNFVSLKIYNLLGKEIMSLLNEFKQAGSYSVTFDAANYPSGVYYYKIKSGSFVQVRKMVLIR